VELDAHRIAELAGDPDRLATGDPAALRSHAELQERWMTSPLPDGRVPMTALAELCSCVAGLGSALGATDPAGHLTPLGWWGRPEALLTVWAD
jgi:hypothetical protein